MLRVTSNVKDVIRRLDRVQRRQVPFATALALTKTALDVKRNEEKMIRRVLDRPTPFTMRSIAIRRATKRRLVATVFVKDIQARYLDLQETGGTRRPKGKALLVPANARLNKYGNMPRRAVKRLLARPDTFSGTINGVGGIWKRKGRTVQLIVAYEARATYRKRLRFKEVALKTSRARFPIQFSRALHTALATAR